MTSDIAFLVPLGGFLLGLITGMAGRWVEFCTLGAIADAVISHDQRRLRGWGLAVAIALGGSQTLHMLGIVDLGQSIYLGGDFGWLGALLGGALFGFGMALVGTCGFGTLIRMGGGDLRAVVDMTVLGIFAYSILSGPVAYLREFGIEASDMTLKGLAEPGIIDLAAAILGQNVDYLRPILVGMITSALLIYCLADPTFRQARQEMMAAAVIGLAIVLGWLTTGFLGHDVFDPTPPVSLTFIRPLGDSILYSMLMSGMSLTFGIASVAGVLLGSHMIARAKNEWRPEGFDGAREMKRHFIGAALMGVGGVLALGCTIGQGLTGLSTLALSAPLACLAIFAGAAFGLHFLEEQSLLKAFNVLIGRKVS